MSMVTSYPAYPPHVGLGGPYPHAPLLPYNKAPRHKVVAQQISQTPCALVPQATPPTALTVIFGSRERDEASTRSRKRPLVMSMVFPAPPYLKEDHDYNKVANTVRLLRLSGYYYENLSWQDAETLLKSSNVGNFIVRNSRDNRFLFSLSVQTERGPTSVRIHYKHGVFRLDCEHHVAVEMPSFPCVVELVEYYISLSESEKGKCCVWLDGSGRRDLPIKITRPRYKKVNSLQHLCRLSLNNGSSGRKAKIPSPLKGYLQQYPHKH